MEAITHKITEWQKNNHNIIITIKDREINPHITHPNEQIYITTKGIFINNTTFYTWHQIRSIQKGGKNK